MTRAAWLGLLFGLVGCGASKNVCPVGQNADASSADDRGGVGTDGGSIPDLGGSAGDSGSGGVGGDGATGGGGGAAGGSVSLPDCLGYVGPASAPPPTPPPLSASRVV